MLSDESVNVAAGVTRTQGGWVGLQLYVMCPDDGTAREIIPALIAVLASYDFKGTADGALKMLTTALATAPSQSSTKDEDLWPAGLPVLQRRGVRGVKTTRK